MHTNYPTGLSDYGYSMQAASIAGALIEHDNAHIYRAKVREWLAKIDDPFRPQFEDFDKGQLFAEFLTDLVRIGSGIEARG